MSEGSTPLLELRSVSKVFTGPERRVGLTDASLLVDPGDFVTITGMSGSGKSTVLNIAGLLDKPTDGDVELFGQDMSGATDADRAAARRGALGFVFQAYNLMMRRTVLENVMIAGYYLGVGRGDRERAAKAALDQVGLGDRLNSLPGQLSGGEQQRVAIARAVASRPRILLCDEPTGNLDAETGQRILELLESFNADGTALVVVTHNADVAMRGLTHIEIVRGTTRVLISRRSVSQ